MSRQVTGMYQATVENKGLFCSPVFYGVFAPYKSDCFCKLTFLLRCYNLKITGLCVSWSSMQCNGPCSPFHFKLSSFTVALFSPFS